MKYKHAFDHPLMNLAGDYIIPRGERKAAVDKWLATRKQEDRDAIILGTMWIVKDLVQRFRAHWPETKRFTDELVSEGVTSLTEFIDGLESSDDFFERVSQFIHSRMRDFINDNRCAFSASARTNRRRQADDKPLEYHYAVSIQEQAIGRLDSSLQYVDIMDAVEQLADCDREDMYYLITMFLEQDHGIDEASLTDEERETVERLSDIGRNLL
jgi:DNA-directed RNA polymerase specialized sigma subunit